MTETAVMPAMKRDRAGKGAARAVRREGLVPCVIYGENADPVTISVDPRLIEKGLKGGHFYSTMYTVEIEGGGKETVLPRDVQFHPVSDDALHVDFLRVGPRTKVAVQVPVVFLNEETSVGLKRGGVLNVVRHEVELYARVQSIPEQIEIDLAEADIGDALKISDVALPDGVTPTITDRDFTIATLVAPRGLVEAGEAEEEGEAAEGAKAEGEAGDEGES